MLLLLLLLLLLLFFYMSGLCRHGQITDIVGAKFVVTMGTSLLYFVDAAAHAKLAESFN